jgi:hypothetical protein
MPPSRAGSGSGFGTGSCLAGGPRISSAAAWLRDAALTTAWRSSRIVVIQLCRYAAFCSVLRGFKIGRRRDGHLLQHARYLTLWTLTMPRR